MGTNVIENVFAKDVFNDAVMAEKLPLTKEQERSLIIV